MITHKLKVEGIDLGHAKISIDNVPMRCRAVNVDMAVDQIHSTKIVMESVPEIDIETWVTFEFTPQTIEQALKVVESALKNGNYEREIINRLEEIIDANI